MAVDDIGAISNDLHRLTNPQKPTIVAGLRSSYVQVLNSGDRPVRFRVRAEPGDWTEYKIGSEEPLTLTCVNCKTTVVRMAIPTDDRGILIRELDLQWRYQIFWDETDKRWDVRPISGP